MAVVQLAVLAAVLFAAQASEFGLPERRSMLDRGLATLKTHRSLSATEGPASGPSESPSTSPASSPDFAPGEGPAGDAFEASVETTLTIGGYTKATFMPQYNPFMKATAGYLEVKLNALHITGGKNAISRRRLLSGTTTVPLTALAYAETADDVLAEANKIADAINDNTAFENALKASALTQMTSFSATKAVVSSVTSLLGSANTKAVAAAVAGVAAALAMFM